MRVIQWLMLSCLLAASGTQAEDGKSAVQDDLFRGKLFAPDLILKYQAQIKLSDAQRKFLRSEVTAIQAKVSSLDWDIMEAGSAVQAGVEQTPVDKPAVLAKIDKLLEADTRKKHAWLEMLINIKNQLTPEQVAFLKSTSAPDARP